MRKSDLRVYFCFSRAKIAFARLYLHLARENRIYAFIFAFGAHKSDLRVYFYFWRAQIEFTRLSLLFARGNRICAFIFAFGAR